MLCGQNATGIPPTHCPCVVLDQAAGIGPAWAWFRAKLGCQQPTPETFWRAVKESNLAGSVLETAPLPEDNPCLAESRSLEDHASKGTHRFPAVGSALAALLSKLADAVRVERTRPDGPSPGSGRLSTPHARILRIEKAGLLHPASRPLGDRAVNPGGLGCQWQCGPKVAIVCR